MNQEKFNVFISIYKEEREKLYKESPELYGNRDRASFDEGCSRMVKAIEQQSYNKDCTPIKETCRRLGIKHTYKAINEYLER